MMAGNATVEVYLDGERIAPETGGSDVRNGGVEIGEERLYHLVQGTDYSPHRLELRIHGKELRAYAFTFG